MHDQYIYLLVQDPSLTGLNAFQECMSPVNDQCTYQHQSEPAVHIGLQLYQSKWDKSTQLLTVNALSRSMTGQDRAGQGDKWIFGGTKGSRSSHSGSL